MDNLTEDRKAFLRMAAWGAALLYDKTGEMAWLDSLIPVERDYVIQFYSETWASFVKALQPLMDWVEAQKAED